MQYRLATMNDVKYVYDLICDLEEKVLDYNNFQIFFEQYVESESYLSILAIENSSVVGCINLRLEYQLHHAARIAEIMELVVGGNARSSGIGTRLFAEAEKLAKERGCIQIEVCCNQSRTRSHNFYEKQKMQNSHFKYTKTFTP